MKKTKVNIYTNCINVYFEGDLAIKFAEYQIQNWKNMPCFRGGGASGHDYYHCVFFAEALPFIEKFLEENKTELKIKKHYEN